MTMIQIPHKNLNVAVCFSPHLQFPSYSVILHISLSFGSSSHLRRLIVLHIFQGRLCLNGNYFVSTPQPVSSFSLVHYFYVLIWLTIRLALPDDVVFKKYFFDFSLLWVKAAFLKHFSVCKSLMFLKKFTEPKKSGMSI